MRGDRQAVEAVTERLHELARCRLAPVVVALDGRSGSGKSTLAKVVSAAVGASVIDGDDFYAGGTAGEWDAMTPAAKVGHCIDWRRQRPVLEALLRGQRASWLPYDWEADDGRLASRPLSCGPDGIVILDGAYSARPELADLLDLRVLLEVPRAVRRARLRLREGESYRADWEARWSSAEDHYFGSVMPAGAFDLIVRT